MKTTKINQKPKTLITKQSPINLWAVIFTCFILMLSVLSLLWILLSVEHTSESRVVIAHIYHNGTLLQSIDLSQVETPYELTVTGANGCQNIIEVRPGCIGMLHADCPDQLCVKQGFYSATTIPITCLPNQVVIELKLLDITDKDMITPDIITY